MATEQTEKLLFSIELSKEKLLADLGQIKTRAGEIRTENKAAAKALDEMAAAGQKGTEAYKKLQTQIATNERELIALRREQYEVNKSLDAVDAAAGSYNRLAAETSVLEKQLKQSVVGLTITAEAYEELRQKVEAGHKAQRDFARSSGDYRALVGAYREELAPAIDAVGEKVEQVDNSLAGLRKRLDDLRGVRETLDPTTKEAQDLNNEILGLSTSIQQAEGKIDEFGDRVQKNLKRENIDTMNDAAGGLIGTLNILNVVSAENEGVAQLQAASLKALAIAQNLRLVQIGIANAREAALIVLQKVKLVQTDAEIAAVGRLTVAQRVYNAVAAINPVGLLIAGLVALGGIIYQLRDRIGDFIGQFGALKAISDSVSGALHSVGVELGFVDSAEAKARAARVKAYTEGLTMVAEQKQQEAELLKAQGAAAETVRRVQRDGLLATIAYNEAQVRETKARIKAEGTATDELKQELKERTAALAASENDLKLLGAEAVNARAEEMRATLEVVGRGYRRQAELLKAKGADELKVREQEKGDMDAQIARLQTFIRFTKYYTAAQILEFKRELAERLQARKVFEAETTRIAIEKAREREQKALTVQIGFLDLKLKQVQIGSDEELALIRQKIRLQEQLELTAANLTAGQRKLIRSKANQEEYEAERQHQFRMVQFRLQAGLDLLNAALAREKKGGEYELELRRNVIAQQEALELASLDKRADNRAKEALIRARAEAEQSELEYQDSLKRLEQYLTEKRQKLDADRAAGRITEEAYQTAVGTYEVAALEARRVVYDDYGRDTIEIDNQITDKQIANQQRVTDKTIEAGRQRLQVALDFGQQVGQLFADSLKSQGREAEAFLNGLLLLVLNSVEKAAIAQATAWALASPDSAATGGITGLVKAAAVTALIAAAFETAKAAISSDGPLFRDGGPVMGPSHERGGIQMYHRSGAHLGEMEGNEIILTQGVYRDPRLRAAASALNVLGGGRAFYSDPTPPATWSHYATGGVVRYDPATFGARSGVNGGSLPTAADIAAAMVPAVAEVVVRAVAALPPSQISVTEFRDKERRVIGAAETARD